MAQPIYKPNASLDSSPIQHVGGAFDKVVETTSKIAAEQQEKREALFQNKQKQGLARATEKLAGISDVNMAEALAKDPAAFMNSIGAAELSDTTQAQIASKLAGVVDQARQRTKNEDEFKTFEQREIVNQFAAEMLGMKTPEQARKYVETLEANPDFQGLTATSKAAVIGQAQGLEESEMTQALGRIEYRNKVYDDKALNMAEDFINRGGGISEALALADQTDNPELKMRIRKRLYEIDEQENKLTSSEQRELKKKQLAIQRKYETGTDEDGNRLTVDGKESSGITDLEFDAERLEREYSDVNSANSYKYDDSDALGMSGRDAIQSVITEKLNTPGGDLDGVEVDEIVEEVGKELTQLEDGMRRAAGSEAAIEAWVDSTFKDTTSPRMTGRGVKKNKSTVDEATKNAAIQLLKDHNGFPAEVVQRAARWAINKTDSNTLSDSGLTHRGFKDALIREAAAYFKGKDRYSEYQTKKHGLATRISSLKRRRDEASIDAEGTYRKNRESRRKLTN